MVIEKFGTCPRRHKNQSGFRKGQIARCVELDGYSVGSEGIREFVSAIDITRYQVATSQYMYNGCKVKINKRRHNKNLCVLSVKGG